MLAEMLHPGEIRFGHEGDGWVRMKGAVTGFRHAPDRANLPERWMDDFREFLVAASIGGGLNFRPVSGWQTASGRRVAEGKVFRSGHPGNLSDDVREQIGTLGVRTVITLQTSPEIEVLGDPRPGALQMARWVQHSPSVTSGSGRRLRR